MEFKVGDEVEVKCEITEWKWLPGTVIWLDKRVHVELNTLLLDKYSHLLVPSMPHFVRKRPIPALLCECGSDKTAQPGHSSWCPKFSGAA